MRRIDLYRRFPCDPDQWFSSEDVERARRYNGVVQRQKALGAFLGVATLVALVHTRALGRLVETVEVGWVLELVIVIVGTLLVLGIVDFPVDVWRYRHDRRWDLSTQAPRALVADQAKEAVVATVVLTAVVVPVWAVIRWTDAWWFLGWCVFVTVFVVFVLVYPLWIMPLFNRFEPIADEALRARIQRFCREAGTPVTDAFVMDASRRTRADNAFFAGAGPSRRVVLFDNVLTRSPREIEVILAHEIGHARRHHLATTIVLRSLGFLAVFFVVAQLSASQALLDWAGIERIGDPAAFPLVALVFGITFATLGLIFSGLSRLHEREADLDALELTRDADAFLDTIKDLYMRNIGDLAPSWWQRIRSDSPAPAERLAFGSWWRSKRTVAVLFTDIEESTPLVERLGDRRWFEILSDHEELVQSVGEHHSCAEVESTGDGFLLVFEDVGQALLCALEIQRRLREDLDHQDIELRVRMGLHTGEVIRKETSVFGRDVHLAARVCAEAKGGEVLVSETVHEHLVSNPRFVFDGRRDVALKGLAGTHTIYTAVPGDRALGSVR